MMRVTECQPWRHMLLTDIPLPPALDCSIADCDYTTPDVEAIVVTALITKQGTMHNVPATNRVTSTKIENVKRPIVSSAGTSEDWSYFLSRWSDYVAATKVSGKDRIIQLLECCDEQLRKDLTRAGGTRTNDTEADVLKAMKKLAVREENTMFACFTLHRMHREEDEPVHSYDARLQGQAGVCKFIIPCPHLRRELYRARTVWCPQQGTIWKRHTTWSTRWYKSRHVSWGTVPIRGSKGLWQTICATSPRLTRSWGRSCQQPIQTWCE